MFEAATYSPLLHTRQSEVRGLRELPDSTKDLLFPVFVLRPWPRAKSIEMAFEKILEAMGGRPFGLDLESDFPTADQSKPAEVEFDELRSPDICFSAYFEKVAQIEGAVPVLRLTDDIECLKRQIDRMAEISRGGFVRIRQSDLHFVPTVLEAIADIPANDFSIFIDAEWRQDVLLQSNWVLIAAQTFFDQEPERAIIICGSSFPNSFDKMGLSKEFAINERLLFDIIRMNLNAKLIYGDWASTRPPSYDNQIKRTVPRIDIAQSSHWPVFRSQKIIREDDDGDDYNDRETYKEVVDRLISSPYWDDVPEIWGRYALLCTSEDLSTSIKSPQTAAAVGVNLHMHVQAHYSTPQLLNATDDPYFD
jgi:hypothetical protein